MANNSSNRTGNVSLFQIFSTKGNGSVDISAGAVDIRYYESVLSNSISLTATVIETGLTNTSTEETLNKGLIDTLPIRGGEQVLIELEDNQPQKNKLIFKDDNSFYVNRVRDIDPGTQQDLYFVDLCTREFIANEQSRVVKRYNEKISDNVVKILRDINGLNTQKNIDADQTAIPYNFIGNSRKPFYVCTWLASKSVPEQSGQIGGAAGYFFYENYDGFKFKSIDNLFNSDPIKKYIFTNTADLPSGYDEKILSYQIRRDIDLQNNLTLGTYSNKSLFFDFVAMDYTVRDYNVDDNQSGKIVSASENDIDYVADEFRTPTSRLMNHILDIGVLPSGNNAQSQLSKWKSTLKEPTYDAANTMVQSIMRYNQLFTIKTEIIISGDFSLRAGDLIYCDFPQLSIEKNPGVNGKDNKEFGSGGIYMIASLCHKITSRDTFTSLTLVRDTFGRKPFN